MMRIFIFLFCTAIFGFTSGTVFSQNAKVFIDTDKIVSIDEVFDILRNQTDYTFIYQEDLFRNMPKVPLKKGVIDADKLLKSSLSRSNFNFDIINNNTIIIKKEMTAMESQGIEITGQILDKNGLSLPGANIIEKGTNNGTQSDFDGNFSIVVNDENATLVVSYVGFLPSEVVLNGQKVINVVMQESSLVLERVVVTGYQTISQELATGSFEKVDEEILDLKLNQNILAKLQGEVPGLLLSGPNNDELIIRGLSSINAETAPLVVVDGFPVEGGFSTINPNDVKSITVLKDAAAASIWGIRATNGVIVIVTKKGDRNNKLRVDLSHSTAFTPKPNLRKNPIGSPATQVAYQRGLFETGGLRNLNLFDDGLDNMNGIDIQSFAQLNPVAETFLLLQEGRFTQGEADARLLQLANTDIREEYSDLILRPVQWNQYNLAISGGGEKHDFRTSITYNHNENGTIAEDADQVIVNFSNSFEVTPKLKARTSLNFSQSKTNNAPDDANDDFTENRLFSAEDLLVSQPINSSILDSNGNYLPMLAFKQGYSSQASQFLLDRGYAYPSTFNIKQEYDNANNVGRNTELRLQAGLDYKLFKDFEINLSYQYERGQNNLRNLYNENTYATRKRVNLLTQLDSDRMGAEKPIPLGAILDLTFGTLTAQTFRGQFDYDTSFNNGRHQLTLLGGYEARNIKEEGSTDRKYGYDDQTLVSTSPDFANSFFVSLDPNLGDILIPNNSRVFFEENRFISYYSNIAYTFKNRYTLSGSTRLDDTNLFGTSDKFRNIPLYSLGVKWNIGNEGFFEASKVSRLQLRATYGTNGNVIRSTSPFLQTTIARNEAPFNNLSSYISSLPNPELRLEKTRTVNLGLDFGFLGQRLYGTLEYYKKNSEDLLANVALNPTLGVSGANINTGKLSNEGIDANFNIKIIDTDDFTYNTTFNFSLNTNTLIRVDNPDPSAQALVFGQSLIVGNALRTLYSFNYAGLDRNGAPQYVDEEGDIVDFQTGVTDINALIKEGTVVPKYYGSWINNIAYKQFSLRILATFKAGHIFRYGDIFGGFNPSFNPFINSGVNVAEDFNNRWRVRGDENSTDIPALPSDAGGNGAIGYENLPFADTFIDNAAHIRLSQVSLGYSFPQNIVDKLSISNFQLGLQADNLSVWTFNKWDVDPESLFFPRQPTITLNINASF